MGNINGTGIGKNGSKKILPSGLKKQKHTMEVSPPESTNPETIDSPNSIPIVLENATPSTIASQNNPFDCPHPNRHSAHILQHEDQNDTGTHLQPPSVMLGHQHQHQHHHCNISNTKRKNRECISIDKCNRPMSDCINDKFKNNNFITSSNSNRSPPLSPYTTPNRSVPSFKDSTLTIGSRSCTSLDSLASAHEHCRQQQRNRRAGSPMTTGSSNRQSLYSQQWTVTTVNDAYNLDEEYDGSTIFLAKDLWRLRSFNCIREAVKDKQRRMHYFLKRVWKGNFLVPLENPTSVIQWACSSGAWCFEMALAYPDCTVIALDETDGGSCTNCVSNLSRRQAPLYEQDSGMSQFEDDSADLIVIRDEFMYFSPDEKWYTLLAEFYRVLKPGGFLEIYGHDFQLNATDPYGKRLDEWTRHLATTAGVSPDFPQKLEKQCRELQFDNVDYRLADLPLGEWPVAPHMKEMGYLAKIIIIKRFQILKRWILGLEEDLTEEEYTTTIKAGMEECERQQNRFLCFYIGAQKPSR